VYICIVLNVTFFFVKPFSNCYAFSVSAAGHAAASEAKTETGTETEAVAVTSGPMAAESRKLFCPCRAI